MGYSKERPDGYYSFELNSIATEKCKISGVTEQDDNALFYQIMDELHGGKQKETDIVIDELAEIIF